MKTEKKISKFCLIGANIQNSLSPAIYNEWFKKYNILASYNLEEICEDEFEEKLPLILKNYEAINVTAPYKKKVRKFLQENPKDSSVNCVYKSVGYSTDLYGFINSLKKLELLKAFSRSNSILIIGRGAMASMIVDYLKENKNEIFEILTKDNNKSFDFSKKFEFVINATNVKNIYKKDVRGEHYLDLNYSKKGKDFFAKYMLLYQAQKCFDIWFGVIPEISQEQMKLLNI